VEHITEAILTSKEKFKSMLMPKNFPFYYDNSKMILAVYAIYPKLTRITCYPVSTNEIWIIRLLFSKLDESQVQDYNKLIQNYQIYHTTGIQEKNSEYIIETYFSPEETKLPRKELEEFIKGFSGISSFEINKIPYQ
jgi:hypothetical protein